MNSADNFLLKTQTSAHTWKYQPAHKLSPPPWTVGLRDQGGEALWPGIY